NFPTPDRLSIREATADAMLIAHKGSRVAANVSSQPPTSASPAPVGSTTLASGKAGTRKTPPSLLASIDPSLPIVITSHRGPYRKIREIAEVNTDEPDWIRISSEVALRRSTDRSTFPNFAGLRNTFPAESFSRTNP